MAPWEQSRVYRPGVQFPWESAVSRHRKEEMEGSSIFNLPDPSENGDLIMAPQNVRLSRSQSDRTEGGTDGLRVAAVFIVAGEGKKECSVKQTRAPGPGWHHYGILYSTAIIQFWPCLLFGEQCADVRTLLFFIYSYLEYLFFPFFHHFQSVTSSSKLVYWLNTQLQTVAFVVGGVISLLWKGNSFQCQRYRVGSIHSVWSGK